MIYVFHTPATKHGLLGGPHLCSFHSHRIVPTTVVPGTSSAYIGIRDLSMLQAQEGTQGNRNGEASKECLQFNEFWNPHLCMITTEVETNRCLGGEEIMALFNFIPFVFPATDRKMARDMDPYHSFPVVIHPCVFGPKPPQQQLVVCQPTPNVDYIRMMGQPGQGRQLVRAEAPKSGHRPYKPVRKDPTSSRPYPVDSRGIPAKPKEAKKNPDSTSYSRSRIPFLNDNRVVLYKGAAGGKFVLRK